MSSNSRYLREFEEFRVDLSKKVLWYGDEPVQLPAKAVEVLCQLIEKPGEVLTKDELLDRVWHDSFVEESVLAQNVHHLRKTFKDLNSRRDLIQTIPRRGYRFAGEVHDIRDDLVFEHEVIEREVITEVSEDSLKDLDLKDQRSTSLALVGQRSKVTAVFIVIAVSLVLGAIAWWWGVPAEATTVNGISSLAVLPLRPLDKERDETFALGLTDSLISRLGRFNKFAVRPFSAVEKYRDSGNDAIAFGQTLKADSVLEGTIQRSEGRLRVNLRLIDVRSGTQIWSENFDETESEILKLQDVISGRVARAIFTRLGSAEEAVLAKKLTDNADAYRLYLTGRERWLQRNAKAESIAFYQKAIELDPNFALPYLGIADEYAFTYETKTAEDALAKAIELDPNLPEAHATRGFLQMLHHWDWQGAENSFRRALELAPNSSKAHHWYGVYLSLRGRLDDAQTEMEKALQLDPTALVVMTDIAELHYFKRDYERAENELGKVLAIDPDFINARANLIKVRFKKGGSFFLESAAFNVYRQRKMKADGLTPEYDPSELEALVNRNDEKTLRENYLKSNLAIRDARPDAYLSLSKYYAITGDKERSLEALEKSVEVHSFVVPFVAVDPLWDPVRDHPRFSEVLKKLNLVS